MSDEKKPAAKTDGAKKTTQPKSSRNPVKPKPPGTTPGNNG